MRKVDLVGVDRGRGIEEGLDQGSSSSVILDGSRVVNSAWIPDGRPRKSEIELSSQLHRRNQYN